MRHCLNPGCLHPSNPENHQFCIKCGQKLLLRERYWAQRILGQGGFGRTFLAVDEDKPSKPFCVIKQLLPQAQGTDNLDKAAELFAQEAEQLEQLGHHDQIPELLAYFTDNDQQYLVQEFVNGATLAQELAENGVFSEQQIRKLLIDLLEILDFVHGQNVIHRDIKPENIIRRRSDGKFVLVDFGAAKVLSRSHYAVTGTVIGSAEYCAPEQAKGRAKLVSDLYSLGVTCIHLLTGKSPFDLCDFNEGKWGWRYYLNINFVSYELGQFLDKLIQQTPNDRYPSAQAALQDLKQSFKYQRLEQHLQAKDWHGANKETLKQMLEVANRTNEGFLKVQDINNFPCEELRSIDRLWVHYSQGNFGFSIQKKIYSSLEKPQKWDSDIRETFAYAVGWRVDERGWFGMKKKGLFGKPKRTWLDDSKLSFDLSAPEGHHPIILQPEMFSVRSQEFYAFFSKLVECDL